MVKVSTKSPTDLLYDAHELLCAVLLHGAMMYDIKPDSDLGKRITKWNADVCNIITIL